jgi:hypothetical protein
VLKQGSIPSARTKQRAPVPQLVEGAVREAVKCEFESRSEHQAHVPQLVEGTRSDRVKCPFESDRGYQFSDGEPERPPAPLGKRSAPQGVRVGSDAVLHLHVREANHGNGTICSWKVVSRAGVALTEPVLNTGGTETCGDRHLHYPPIFKDGQLGRLPARLRNPMAPAGVAIDTSAILQEGTEAGSSNRLLSGRWAQVHVVRCHYLPPAPLAQWQSTCVVSRRSSFRLRHGAPV